MFNINMIFLIDWQRIWFKNYFEELIQKMYINENPQNAVILEIVSISVSVSIENHPCYPNKEKRFKLFVYSCYYSLSIQMNIFTLYNKCYVISTTYMLDSALEPSYNLSKIFFLLPWILKLIVYMVNDSTPLLMYEYIHLYYLSIYVIFICGLKQSWVENSESNYLFAHAVLYFCNIFANFQLFYK